ncbi:MAG: dUTP diphosphatase [Bacteroidales bacterium]|jgi:dUTP pyrophosphatase|nr:dUTP diphosphatase [Bacteroidales bacterium]
MIVKVVNHSQNELPEYKTLLAAGMDLMADLKTPLIILPSQRALIPTGLFIEIPQGFEAQVRPRSGLAIKDGISVLNSPGTVDADYRGEIKVILINLSDKEFEVRNGDRIAQMVFSKFERIEWQISQELGETDRGSGGFGHSGV